MVAPELVRAGQAHAARGGAGINDWGQRDRPRQKSPAAGISRVVFIGDSFLEETGGVDPVSVAVEDRLKGGGIETVNLGVSATAPDEYYWRLKNIALALEPERIVVFLYAVNDWIRRPTLPSFHGIAAPYPRDSALETLGLGAINHFLMGDRRPYLRAWFGRAEGLRATEDARFDEIRRTPDAHMPLYLARNFIGRKFRDRAAKFLETVKPQAFYAGLRNPDAGRFRSYYLTWAMKFLGFANRPFAKVATGHVRYVAALLEAMRALCAARGVGFTVVVVPEASQVDPQFRKFWAQISSLHMGLLYTRTTSRALSERAGAAGLPIL